MQKKWITIIIILLALILGAIFYFYKITTSDNNNDGYETQRTATNSNMNNTLTDADTNTSSSNEQTKNDNVTSNEQEEKQEQNQDNAQGLKEDKELASFTTKIYTKDSKRQNNISITCSALNNTDVANGQTFSFCNTVGRASPSRGYQKADIFTNGKKIKGYGGGNCQISTTLYNAVLKVPNLKVTERHEHSNKVPYIQTGKDAAVSYGSYDFKFVNNTGNSIRIKATNSTNNITIKLIKLI